MCTRCGAGGLAWRVGWGWEGGTHNQIAAGQITIWSFSFWGGRSGTRRSRASDVLRVDGIAPEAHPTLTSVIRVIERRVAIIKGGWHGWSAVLRGRAIRRASGEGRRRRVIGGAVVMLVGRIGVRGGESGGGVLVLLLWRGGALDELDDLERAGLTDV
jgi:hypothetical protein